MVSIYSKPGCQPCKRTKAAFDKRGIAYTERDVTVDEAALARVQELGYMSMPVVEAGDTHWSGYQPDLINDVAV